MNRFSLSVIVAIALFLTLGQISHADVIVNLDFTAAEGFADGGPAPGSINYNNTDMNVFGQGTTYVEDSAGAGFFGANAGFGRALLGDDDPNNDSQPSSSLLKEANILGLAAGSTIIARVTNFDFVTNTDNRGNPIGLVDGDTSNPVGNSSLAIGGEVRNQGGNVFIDNGGFGNSPASAATGIAVDTTPGAIELSEYEIVLTSTGSGTFDIDHFINGSATPILSETGIAPVFGKPAAETAGFFQSAGAQNARIDSFFLEINPVIAGIPEPGSLSVLGLLGLALVARRRA
jgi:hypothetical protein